VKNELFLVVAYKFEVDIEGHSARGHPQVLKYGGENRVNRLRYRD